MQQIDRFKPVHPFPARMAPSIALDELPSAEGSALRVLDPMSGSGTTLVVARARGHAAMGFDTDPLARLISHVWCADVTPEAITNAAESIAEKAAKRLRTLRQSEGYPATADDETRAFVRYWFDVPNRRQLRALADEIEKTRDSNLRNVLWCSFSRLIIAKARGASYAMDLSHSRPHRVMEKVPFRPLPNFLSAVRTVVQNSPFKDGGNASPKVTIRKGDARFLPLDDSSIDIVITSPPYLNAIDYMRCNKFSLIWMGHQITDLRRLRSRNIGTEVSQMNKNKWLAEVTKSAGDIDHLPDRDRRMLIRYVGDMNAVIREIARVLSPRGRCVLVIGDCTMRGVFIRNSEVLKRLGNHHGLQTIGTKARELPANRRYLPPPSSQQAGTSLQNRMREEIVLTLIAEKQNNAG